MKHEAQVAFAAQLLGTDGPIVGHRLPPHKPPTAKDYTKAGLPWFDYYSDKAGLSGSAVLKTLKSVAAKSIEFGTVLTHNEPVAPKIVKTLGSGVVRDGEF